MNETEGLPLNPTADPRVEYVRRRDARLAEASRQMHRFRKFGIVRLASLAIGLVLLWFVWSSGLSPWWLLPPVIVFVALAETQSRISRGKRRCERAAALYDLGIARLADRWAGTGATGERFELLSRARTRAGEETLANWLLHPATPDVVRPRQAAVIELRPLLDLREDLALLTTDVRSGKEAHSLAAWSTAPPWHISPWLRITAITLAMLAVVTFILWAMGFGGTPLLVALVLGRIFAFRFRSQVERVVSGVDAAARDLVLLSGVLKRLEQERFTSPRLVELRAALDVEGLAASQQIAKLNRLIDLLDARRNMMFAPLAFLLLWEIQFAIAIERWRQRSGPAVVRWLEAVGEIEALSSLAGHAYERPQDPFPELSDQGTRFEGEGLGHPLIPDSRNVRTDLRLSDEGPRVLIVSGSNMSGKSTLLRTIGTNTVLALAGATVRARRLRLSPLQVGASIRIQDSLQAGTSRFYAEITRLRQIVELTKGELPVLFLRDEILHGTNSHDRLIGAEGVVRGLIDRGAVGLVTTHDLALARIADELGPYAANVHFEDQLEDGKMSFDYRLRDGIVRRSNALELMRSVGLEV